MSLFFLDKAENLSVSYDKLLVDLTDENAVFYPFMHSKSTYAIFKNLLLGLLTNQDIVLLDSEFTEDETAKMLGSYDKTLVAKEVNLKLQNFSNVQENLKNSTANISLFTSGTTGQPKQIKHTVTVFTNFIRSGEKYSNHVWGLAYNPTHMAGLQVFFQAFLNKNTLVKLFGLPNREIVSLLQETKISHLSATPTFYRLLDVKETVETVKRITFGGEKSNKSLYEKIQASFPNAKINNIYATTEFGTLFISEGTDFKISKQNEHLIKFSDDLLYVHKSLVGANLENIEIKDDWYCTQDKIEVVSEQPFRFRFVSRVSSTINVGGYNVDLKETEEALLQCESVKLARVYAKPNRLLGNILRAEVILEEGEVMTEKDLLNILSEKLQTHKLPRVIKFVKEIGLTRTGKIKQ